MAAYVIRRVLGMIPSLLLLVLLTVVMVRLIPGNVVDLMLQEQGTRGAQKAALERNLGLDKPVIVSYADYLKDVARGNLGKSLWTGQSVLDCVGPRIPITMSL